MEELAPEHKAQYDAVAATEVTTAFFLATCRSVLRACALLSSRSDASAVDPLPAFISCAAGVFLRSCCT